MTYNEPDRPYEEKWSRSAHDDFSQAKGPPMLPFRNDPTTLPFGSTDKVSFRAGGITRMDQVNHPVHYTSSGAVCSKCNTPIECIDVVKHMGFLEGNVTKYVWRWKYKGGVQDLKKATFYLQRLIEQAEGSPPAA